MLVHSELANGLGKLTEATRFRLPDGSQDRRRRETVTL